MSWFNDLKVSKKIGLGFCAVLAMTFALGATALLKLDHVRGDVELMATDRLPTVKVLYSMQSDVQDLRRKEMGLLLDYPANEDAWKEKFAKIRQQLDEDEKTYLPMMTSEEEKALFQTFRTNLDKYEEFRKKEIAMAEAGHQREAATVALGEGLEVFEGMSKPLMQNVDLNTKDADRSAADALEQYKQARTWTIVMLAAALGLGLVLSVVITRSIAQPVSETMAVLESLAARDLTHTAEVKSKDELGAMGGALNRTIEALRDTLATISAGAQQLAGATQQLSAGASETAERSRSQADQTRQAATAMLEMTSTVQQISENSQQASDASKRAADAARSGGSVVEETLATMRTISESTAKVSSTVAELGKSSEQIGMIISVINDIADQTNLLALNAAIEAARAGEQGRGFAVVADEVRKLAERTTTATKEIATMIASIQNETGTAVRAMELSNRGVEQGLEKTSASGVALQEIIHVSEHVGDMIMQIATAATQQAAATEQVNSNVSQISESNEQSLQATEEAAKACVDLSKLAHDLERTVAQFKLEESGQGNYTRRMPGRAMAAAAHA